MNLLRAVAPSLIRSRTLLSYDRFLIGCDHSQRPSEGGTDFVVSTALVARVESSIPRGPSRLDARAPADPYTAGAA
jgi:hypothetical protein